MAIAKHKLHAIKFIPPLAYLGGSEPWDDGIYGPFWRYATSLKVPVFFTLGTGPAEFADTGSPAEVRQGYLDELRILMRWMERYPDTVCSLTHGFPWRTFLDGDRIVLPEAIWEPFRNPKCHLEVCFPIRIGGTVLPEAIWEPFRNPKCHLEVCFPIRNLFDHPYREVWPTLEQMVEHVGPDQLLWGTDMPFQNRFCTYRQSRGWIEKYCTDFLGKEALAKVMGGTAAGILGEG